MRPKIFTSALIFTTILCANLITSIDVSETASSKAPETRESGDDELPHVASNVTVGSLRQLSVFGSLFGQVAKGVVYGGAAFAQFNSRLLCPLLSRETEKDNTEQPTLFVFNNPAQREVAAKIYADDEITGSLTQEAQFDPNQMTVIFVHGWLGGIQNELWLTEAKNVALGHDSANSDGQQAKDGEANFRPNVIIVDWSEFAKGSLYEATENSHKVSRRLAKLLEQLTQASKLRPELMHCLGHSIGAHICGRAARQAFPPARGASGGSSAQASGNQVQRFGRITGLDPGGFCYELGIKNETSFLGLRPSDALLVDALVTNRSPFGNRYQVAHHNVRVNNGFFQRPCSVWRNPDVASEYFRTAVSYLLGNSVQNDILTCDHYFATRFAHQLLRPGCSYVAYACDSYRNFLRGQCGSCDSPAQCYTMDFEWQRPRPQVSGALEVIGSRSSQSGSSPVESSNSDDREQESDLPGQVPYGKRRVYYMRVSDEEPYCSLTFRLRVVLAQDFVSAGSLSLLRANWLKLRLLGSQEEIVSVKDASSNRLTDTVSLHGPWTQRFAASDDIDPVNESSASGWQAKQEKLYGINNRTLTALVELVSPSVSVSSTPSGRFLQPPISDLIAIYDNDNNRQLDNLSTKGLLTLGSDMIEAVHLDYLSSADRRIRSYNSRSFEGAQIRIFPKRGRNANYYT